MINDDKTLSEKYFEKNGYKPKGEKKCESCGKNFTIYLKRDLERKKYCSKKCFGKIIRTHTKTTITNGRN